MPKSDDPPTDPPSQSPSPSSSPSQASDPPPEMPQKPLEEDERTKPTSKKRPKKKPKTLSEKRRAETQQRLDLLTKNLRPIPFLPSKPLNFTPHEALFKALNLWEFAQTDLSEPIRTDLLTQLIANYDHQSRQSRVNDVRIAVSRPDLARSLNLPWKKDKEETNPPLLSTEESISILLDFLSTYILLQEEDACILPLEAMKATQLIKEGQASRVDWIGLLWTMIEKELKEAHLSGFCFYASHLQRLILHQKPSLFLDQDEHVIPPCDDVTMQDVDHYAGLLQPALTAEKCLEEAQGWMERARMVISEKERDVATAQYQAQYVNSLLMEKDRHIEVLEKARMEEQRRREMEICHVEHELLVMAKIIQGYRKALGETRRAFAEYRKRFPEGERQLYVDDGEGEGGVLTAAEVERERVLRMVRGFEEGWAGRFLEHERRVESLGKRLGEISESLAGVGSLLS